MIHPKKSRIFTLARSIISIKIWVIYLGVNLVFSCGISKSLNHRPDISNFPTKTYSKKQVTDSFYTYGPNFLIKNKYGFWEMYIEGNALERGMAMGELSRDLVQKQELIFFDKINELVPGKTRQFLLKKFLAWYNRKMYLHVIPEYKREIYALSRYMGDKYDNLAPDYLRLLYLHGAHDIGHALTDLALVGCSSFAVWGNKSKDGDLLLARNFDFYAGDDFAKEKILYFIKPQKGIPYVSMSWAGMTGVVSGMNRSGITVTINAGKSAVPLVAKNPISLVTKEILQYAKNIKEAIEIAKKRKVFVSESIMVGSAVENKAVLIEMTPNQLDVFDVNPNHILICTNHFQSKGLKNDSKNLRHIKESHSAYRFNKLSSAIGSLSKIDPSNAVDILRDNRGVNGENLGNGNEKSINQLLAHHGIVFQPKKNRFWVSAPPYQMGEMVSYDLDFVFHEKLSITAQNSNLFNEKQNIPKDSFLLSKAYKDYEKYRVKRKELLHFIEEEIHILYGNLKEFIDLNPHYWEAYYLAAEYCKMQGYSKAAFDFYNKALAQEVVSKSVENKIKNKRRKVAQK